MHRVRFRCVYCKTALLRPMLEQEFLHTPKCLIQTTVPAQWLHKRPSFIIYYDSKVKHLGFRTLKPQKNDWKYYLGDLHCPVCKKNSLLSQRVRSILMKASQLFCLQGVFAQQYFGICQTRVSTLGYTTSNICLHHLDSYSPVDTFCRCLWLKPI